jgi:hypothetical protein
VALQLAMHSTKIRADVIEAQEFPDLARKYQLRAVPVTIVNDEEALVGSVPPIQMVEAVERAGKTE